MARAAKALVEVGIGHGTPGPGRPKGQRNKKTQERMDLAMQILQSGQTPLQIMWNMARGTRKFDAQILEACKAAAPYVHPKLIAVKMDANVTVSHEEALDELDGLDETLAERAALTPMQAYAALEGISLEDEE